MTDEVEAGWYPDPEEKGWIRYWDGEAWTTRKAEPGRDVARSDRQLGIALGFAGAGAMVLALFLPMADSTEFLRVANNSLIQHGEGKFVLLMALAAAVCTYELMNLKGRAVWPLAAIGILVCGLAAYVINSDALTLTSANRGGFSLTQELEAISHTEKASPGTGIYALGLGGILTLVASYLLRPVKTE